MYLRISALFFVTALAGCGGSGGSGSSGPPPTEPTPCPIGYAGTAPACSIVTSGSTTISTSGAAVTASLPAVGGYTGSIQVPAANVGATLDVALSTNAPAGVPILQSKTRRLESVGTHAPLLYFTVTANANVTLDGIPKLTLTLPGSVNPSQSFYLAGLDPMNGWTTLAAGAVTGRTVTLTGPAASLALTANQPLQLAFYIGGVMAQVTISPAQVQLLDVKATQTLSVSENWPSPTFTIDTTPCNGIATANTITSTSFLISAVKAGTCTMTVTDSSGNSASVPVSVTSTTVIGQ